MTVPQTSFVFMTLTDLKNAHQIFCRLPLRWACLISFSWSGRDYVFGGEKALRSGAIFITSCQGNILLGWLITVDGDLDELAEVAFVIMCSPHLRSTELRSTSLRTEHLYGNYLGFFHMGDLCTLLHLLVCSILSLYPYGLKEIYFILEVTIQYYFVSFVAQVFPALAIASSFS